MSPGKTILYLQKSLLKRERQPVLRGVELFDALLIRDLMAAGHRVTLPLVCCWEPLLRERLPTGCRLQIISCFGGSALNGLLAALFAGRHDALIIGNVGNGLVPAIKLLFATRRVGRAALIANREAAPRFVAALRRYAVRILAVNNQIAAPFRTAGYPLVDTDYGIPNAEEFFPAAEAKPADAPVDFCVVGQLDNAWKGADTAIAAFQKLPDAVRARCRLHLASFVNPPTITTPGIQIYPWLPAAAIPTFLRRMDVMLVPSRDEHVMRETFSQVIVQGMLTGLPIIASDRPVLMEKLDTGGGLIFQTLEQLVQGLEKLAGDAALRRRLGAEARRIALERYVWNTDRFIRKYLFPDE
ncbi:MAG: glycosyltransferase [Verrucomicrobia bacterium]|nr:MAG: glycosyltransferase [Verrucomicrobiota bacterium]